MDNFLNCMYGKQRKSVRSFINRTGRLRPNFLRIYSKMFAVNFNSLILLRIDMSVSCLFWWQYLLYRWKRSVIRRRSCSWALWTSKLVSNHCRKDFFAVRFRDSSTFKLFVALDWCLPLFGGLIGRYFRVSLTVEGQVEHVALRIPCWRHVAQRPAIYVIMKHLPLHFGLGFGFAFGFMCSSCFFVSPALPAWSLSPVDLVLFCASAIETSASRSIAPRRCALYGDDWVWRSFQCAVQNQNKGQYTNKFFAPTPH